MEIEASFWRIHIEENLFSMKFLEVLNDDFHNKLTNKEYYDKNPFSMKELKYKYNHFEKEIIGRQAKLDSLDLYNEEYEMFTIHKVKNDKLGC